MDIESTARGFALIATANSVPWALGRLLRTRWAAPLDLGVVLPDGQRLFGDHKTWRGFLGGALACGFVSQALGSGYLLGCATGAVSLLADALSSAVKRRLRREPGAEVPGLDQLPEAILPLALFATPLELRLPEIAAIGVAFFAIDVALARLRHS